MRHLDKFWSYGASEMAIIPSLFLVVSNIEYATQGISDISSFNGNRILNPGLGYGFDNALDDEAQIEFCNNLPQAAEALKSQNSNIVAVDFEGRAINKAEYFGLYGGLFFVGIILSLLFVSVAVLIIYYKQIVEGYEDKSRFEIMQKVGMTKKEIRKSINSQLLTVFFLPLAFAGIHLAFAFPILQKLLLMFNITNTSLFILTTAASFLVFGIFYSIVYRVTSSFYYNIVSSNGTE